MGTFDWVTPNNLAYKLARLIRWAFNAEAVLVSKGLAGFFIYFNQLQWQSVKIWYFVIKIFLTYCEKNLFK